jgi:hypothetical protein
MAWNGSSWISEEVDSGHGQYSLTKPLIVVDSMDNPHICYNQVWEYLKYAKKTETGWSIEEVDKGQTWWSDIAIDSNNIPHISYVKFTSWYYHQYDLKYAYRSNNGWNTTTLEMGGNFGSSIALDSNDYPQISYNNRYSTGRALKHAWWNGTKWIYSVVDFGDYPYTGRHSSTVIDSQDYPHISYYDGTEDEDDGDMKYAHGNLCVPENHPPEDPTISGERRGEELVEYNYSFKSEDLDGDDVWYMIDWGDNQTFASMVLPSGVECMEKHRWFEKGKYTIKAKAIDFLNAESGWSYFEVTIPRTKVKANSLFQLFFDRFPFLEVIISRIMNL